MKKLRKVHKKTSMILVILLVGAMIGGCKNTSDSNTTTIDKGVSINDTETLETVSVNTLEELEETDTKTPTPTETVVVITPVELSTQAEIIVEDRNEYAIIPAGSMQYSAREEGNPEIGALEAETVVLVFAQLSNGYSYVFVEATGEEFGVLTSVLQPYTDSTSVVTPTATPTPTSTITDLSMILYAKQSVNVRSGPSKKYGKLGSLSINQEVTITGQASNGWYRIVFSGSEGYVSDGYLTDTMSAVATTPTTTEPTTIDSVITTEPTTTAPVTTDASVTTSTTPAPIIDWWAPSVEEPWVLDVDAYIAEMEANLRAAGKVTITEYIRANYGCEPLIENTDGAGYAILFIGEGNYQWSADTIANGVINAYYIEYIGYALEEYSKGCYEFRIYLI